MPLAEGKLSLDGNDVWVDTWAFEQATGQIEQILRGALGRATPERLGGLGERLRRRTTVRRATPDSGASNSKVIVA